MSPARREHFDRQLEQVLAELPPVVHKLLDEVPLYVEDFPSREVRQSMNLGPDDDLCGLHTGVPLTERSVEQSGTPSNIVFLYRRGIYREAEAIAGRRDDAELRNQIRITLLHELGHYHGLDEDELDELGYG